MIVQKLYRFFGISFALLLPLLMFTTAEAQMITGSGYWDHFAVDLNVDSYYWNFPSSQNGNYPLTSSGDPLVTPDPGPGPVIYTGANTVTGGITYVYGGMTWGDNILESDSSSAEIDLKSAISTNYYLSVTLDTMTYHQLDCCYPSWGEVSGVTVQPWNDGTSDWGTAIDLDQLNWLYSTVPGTSLSISGTTAEVGLGTQDIGDPETGMQVEAIYGVGVKLPAATGYRISFDTDLHTWDSYRDGGNSVPPPTCVSNKTYTDTLDEHASGSPDPGQLIAWSGSGSAWDDDDLVVSGEIDAQANDQDNLFMQVVQNKVALVFSAVDDGDLSYQLPEISNIGTWATAQVINAANPPDDVNSVDLYDENTDSLYSLAGDPGGVAIFNADGSTFLTTAQLQVVLEGFLKKDLTETPDLDALMADIEIVPGNPDATLTFSDGDAILFSLEDNNDFTGSEIFVWDFINGIRYFEHGGVMWDGTFYPDDINALEAVILNTLPCRVVVPEASTILLFLTLISVGWLLRKK